MSIERTSMTDWVYEYPDGDINNWKSIKATPEGLEIDEQDTIPWEELFNALSHLARSKKQ